MINPKRWLEVRADEYSRIKSERYSVVQETQIHGPFKITWANHEPILISHREKGVTKFYRRVEND